jgi:hypothetical protein
MQFESNSLARRYSRIKKWNPLQLPNQPQQDQGTRSGGSNQGFACAQVKDVKNQFFDRWRNKKTPVLFSNDVWKYFAIQSFAKSLLDVSDNLMFALDAPFPPKLWKETTPHWKRCRKGLTWPTRGWPRRFSWMDWRDLANNQSRDVFNPEIHEALFEHPRLGKGGTNLQTSHEGWIHAEQTSLEACRRGDCQETMNRLQTF